MDCRDLRQELRGWLRQALDSSEPVQVPERLAVHARSCEGCAAALRAARLLADGKSLYEVPPVGLATRVASRIEAGAPPRRWPRHLIPTAAAAAAVLAVVGLATVLRAGRATTELVVHLRIEAPRASAVYVVGDWNGWDPQADPLSDQDGDGVWETTVKLDPNRDYRYQFYIDGSRWLPDPSASLTIDDGFGGRASILQL